MDDEMREIIDRIRSRDGETVWNTSALAAYLQREGLMQSRVADFSPRSSLVGLRKAPKLARRVERDAWPST
jgi:hypothetical protein